MKQHVNTALPRAVPQCSDDARKGHPRDRHLAEGFKALAHPVRLSILRALAASDQMCCRHLVDRLPLAQSTVSQHLKILRGAGLIKAVPDGQRVCYCLDKATFDSFAADGADLLRHLAGAANTSCTWADER